MLAYTQPHDVLLCLQGCCYCEMPSLSTLYKAWCKGLWSVHLRLPLPVCGFVFCKIRPGRVISLNPHQLPPRLTLNYRECVQGEIGYGDRPASYLKLGCYYYNITILFHFILLLALSTVPLLVALYTTRPHLTGSEGEIYGCSQPWPEQAIYNGARARLTFKHLGPLVR